MLAFGKVKYKIENGKVIAMKRRRKLDKLTELSKGICDVNCFYTTKIKMRMCEERKYGGNVVD
jgi:hypothetical protein